MMPMWTTLATASASTSSRHQHTTTISLLVLGAAAGALVTYWTMTPKTAPRGRRSHNNETESSSAALAEARDRRERLPQTILLVRHGESECNADHTLWRTKPDNLVSLTVEGVAQAAAAGHRAERILRRAKAQRVHLVVSPFERSLQTATALRRAFERRIVRTEIESRIREQEFGNLQGDAFEEYRREQQRVGRFWYRFPTGESGADVYDRVKSWWYESVLSVNVRVGYEPIDALVVVTHGLTMRFVLMQLFGWSPTTFHSVWNAGNCDLYVLKKDMTKPGPSPYVLDETQGDMPRSSIDLLVELASTGETQKLNLKDYLSIPPPRMTRINMIKLKLAEQYPHLDPNDIRGIQFMPFIDGAFHYGRTSSGTERGVGNVALRELSSGFSPEEDGQRPDRMFAPEASCRFPNLPTFVLNS